jgi:exosortase/archaeosortase family protein
VVRAYPPISYEAGSVFYGLYIIGLFLVFFDLPALKESASAVFLVVVGGASFVMGEWLEFYMEPLVPQFVWIMVGVLGMLGIPVTDYGQRWILLNAPRGAVPVSFEAGCIGIESFLVFAVLVVVTMLEESGSIRTKVLWTVLGVIGTFLVNILRVSMIAVVIYYFGYEQWGEIHSWIGYAMFLAWLGIFFAVFSKREAIAAKMRVFLQRF